MRNVTEGMGAFASHAEMSPEKLKKGLRILHINSSAAMRDAIRINLKKHDPTIIIYGYPNGDEALRWFDREKRDMEKGGFPVDRALVVLRGDNGQHFVDELTKRGMDPSAVVSTFSLDVQNLLGRITSISN